MRILIAAALAVFLSACGSDDSVQPVDTQMDNSMESGSAPDAQSMEFVPPNDGKLSDEHMKMYIAVKIKEKMLEQSREAEPVNAQSQVGDELSSEAVDVSSDIKSDISENGTAKMDSNNNIEANIAADTSVQTTMEIDKSQSTISLEQTVVNEFGYDVKLYQWIKQTVADSLSRNSIQSIALQSVKENSQARNQLQETQMDPVVSEINGHNDAIVERYAQELAFAHSDSLSDGDPKPANQAENVANQPADPNVTHSTGS